MQEVRPQESPGPTPSPHPSRGQEPHSRSVTTGLPITSQLHCRSCHLTQREKGMRCHVHSDRGAPPPEAHERSGPGSPGHRAGTASGRPPAAPRSGPGNEVHNPDANPQKSPLSHPVPWGQRLLKPLNRCRENVDVRQPAQKQRPRPGAQQAGHLGSTQPMLTRSTIPGRRLPCPRGSCSRAQGPVGELGARIQVGDRTPSWLCRHLAVSPRASTLLGLGLGFPHAQPPSLT